MRRNKQEKRTWSLIGAVACLEFLLLPESIMARYTSYRTSSKRSALVNCGNHSCPRTNSMILDHYTTTGPFAHTPPEEVHRVAAPTNAGSTIHCAMCNHFTIFCLAGDV
jgi:hypothetical protein